MTSGPEIVIIIVIVMLVFGIGKLGTIGAQLGKTKRAFSEGLHGDDSEPESQSRPKKPDVIDITPADDEPEPDWNPKPGARPQPVEDANVDPD